MRTATMATLTLLLTCTAAFAQQKGTITDARDKKKYQTVSVGGLVWFAENLSYNAKGSKCKAEENLNEGVDCVKEKSSELIKCVNIECLEWIETREGNYCNKYKNLTAKQIQDKKKAAQAECAKSGREYDQETAKTACPTGWHLPNEKEWDILKRAIGNNTDEYGFNNLSSRSSFVRCVQGKSSEEALAEYEKKAAAEKEAAEKAAEAVEKAEVEKGIGKQFNPKIKYGSMTDARDKITYKTVKIGNQTWMAENLNHNANGSRCYKDKDYFCKRDGRLYDWATAKTACPAGWHLPTDGGWTTLENAVGGKGTAGAKLKATSGWISSYGDKKPINGTDDFGFSALPTGSGGWNAGKDFKNANEGTWWSASEKGSSGIGRNIVTLPNFSEQLGLPSGTKTLLYSVRCVEGEAPKDEAPAPAAATAGNPSKTMYCVSSVMNNPISCIELTDTPADKSICDTQNSNMKKMMGKAEWTANKPSVKCDKVGK